ncbi:MAG: type II toxin-antitoxin system RelE/ParE family toxin [Phycisphaeraceae bacterium]
MGVIEWVPIAQADIDAIHDYISRDNPSAADRLVFQIKAKLEGCLEFPRANTPRDDLEPGCRSIPHGNYLIFYMPIENGIRVVRVLDGRRDVERAYKNRD